MKKANTKVKKFIPGENQIKGIRKAATGTNLPGGDPLSIGGSGIIQPPQGGLSARDNEAGQNAVGPMPKQGGYQAAQGPAYSTLPNPSSPEYGTPQPAKTGGTDFKVKMGGLNPKGGINTSDLFMGSLGLISSMLPNTPIQNNQQVLQEAYNPFPNGTGSQAIFEDGGKLDAKSGIHIKPQNKGKFTEYKKRTGKTTEEALHSKDPHVRQMANFAKNAKKWKHEDGGKIEYMMGGSMGSPSGMSGQLATMTSNMGSGKNKRRGKAADGDIIPLSEQDKANWNAFHSDLAHNNPNYGTDYLNHNRNAETSIQSWNKVHLEQAINRPVQDYQKEFDTTPLGRSKIDNYGTNTNQEVGQQTGASSFKQYEYMHYDKNNKLIGHVNPTFKPMTQDQVNSWEQGNRDNQWQSNDQGIPMPGTSPTPIVNQPSASPVFDNSQAINNRQMRESDTTGKYDNMYLSGPAQNYSVDSVRNNDEAYYGGTMKAADGLQIEQNQFKMLSPQTGELGGYSHEETRPDGSSGTDVNYGGQSVEGQRGEPFAIGNDGSLNLFGKMYVPGTNTKFDAAAKKIAKDENKVSKSNTKANELVSVDPTNKYQRLTFGSGKVMLDGNAQKAAELDAQKEALAHIQNTMHTMANDLGVQPKELSSTLKARYGMSLGKSKKWDDLSYQDIDDTMTQVPDFLGTAADGAVLTQQKQMMKEHPDWVDEALQKYGMPNAKKFDDGLDGPRTQYVKNYVATKQAQEQTRGQDIDLRPSGKPSVSFGPGAFDPNAEIEMPDAIPSTYNPGPTGVVTPPPDPADTAIWRQGMTDQEAQDNINNRKKPVPVTAQAQQPPFKPFKNKLGVWDILPEAITAFEQVEPVPGHTINSYLKTPYNVSFQDERNENMSTFNAVAKNQVENPSVLGAMAGQQYVANNNTNAKEFRTNQGIFNDVSNDNYKTLNEDKRMQLQLDMDQEGKQAAAKAYTKRDKFNALEFLASKQSAVERANFTNSMYNSMYHSQGVDSYGRPLHQDNAYFSNQGVSMANLNPDESKTKYHVEKNFIYDSKGRKVGEVDDKSRDQSKFGKKIPKKLPDNYKKL